MIGLLILIACGLGFAWYGSGILVRLASDRRLRRRTRSQGVLALTFDDGPGAATTPELLDLLEARKGKATFFLIGEYATRNPEIVERIAADGPERRLVGLKLDGRRSPRQGMSVLDGDRAVGIVTSGCPSPTLGHPIGMAYVPAEMAEAGGKVRIDLGGGTDAEIVPLPFYKRP